MTKVLLVEDDQFLLKMYRKKFEIEGFEVEIAHDGEEGIAKIKIFLPDIVMMDIMMPKLNGLDALAMIKADSQVKHIPVIILTNLSSIDDADTAVKKGAAGYMIKSDVTPIEVVKKAKSILALAAN